MPDDEELKRLLIASIAAQEKADTSVALRHIADNFAEHEVKDEGRHQEVLGALKGHSLRVSAVEKITDKLDDKWDATGSHQIADLRERNAWVSRFIIGTLASVALIIVTTVITLLAKK